MALALIDVQSEETIEWVDQGEVATKTLERKLMSLAGDIAAAEAQWLVWLGEWLIREGWGSWGCRGPVDWLQWQCGMAPQTAREKVRIATAMRELPMISKAFLNGRLSYSKVRALTRVAEPHNEDELAKLAVGATGAQLDRIVRARAAGMSDKAELSAWERRGLRTRRDDALGTDPIDHITISIPSHDADRFFDRVDAEVNAMIDDAMAGPSCGMTRKDFITSRGGLGALRCDAVVAISLSTARSGVPDPTSVEVIVNDDNHTHHEECSCTCAQNAPAEAPTDQRHENAPAEAPVIAVLDFQISGDVVNPRAGERLCCDPRVAALVEDSRGSVLGVGRANGGWRCS